MDSGKNNVDLNKITDSELRDLFERTWERLKKCGLCPIRCGADRASGEIGPCGAALQGDVFYAGLLMNEEPDLNPAYEVFFTGCNLSCRFCYLQGKVKGQGLMMKKHCEPSPLEKHPLYNDPGLGLAKSICAVGGEPAVNLPASLYLFGTTDVRPRVWNSNMYYSKFTAEVVAEAADLVVADIHFGNDECAERVAGAGDYLDTVTGNIEHASRSGLKVIIRHLLMPGHLKCCGWPVICLMRERFADLRFHPLFNYLPPGKSQAGACAELCQKVSEHERKHFIKESTKAGLRLEPYLLDPFTNKNDLDETIAVLDRSDQNKDEGEIIVDARGGVAVPHLTPGLLRVAREIMEA